MSNIQVKANLVNEFLHEIKLLDYCILRNYNELPFDPGNDLDLLTNIDEIYKIGDIIGKLTTNTNWHIINIKKLQGYISYVLLYTNQNNRPVYYQIDIWWEFSWQGFIWYDAYKVLENKIRYKTIYIPQPVDEAIVTLMKELIPQGITISKYYRKIHNYISSEPNLFIQRLKTFFGRELAQKIFNLIRNEEWCNLETIHVDIIKMLKIKSWKKGFVNQFRRITVFYYMHLLKFINRPSGIMIVLIGPDGTGKTTLSKKIRNEYMRLPFRKTHLYHAHFNIIPRLQKYLIFIKKIFNQNKSNSNLNNHTNNSSERSFINSFIVIMYHTFDYFLGGIKVFYYKRRNDLIIFDRYYYDYIIQSEYKNTPLFIKRLLSKLIPKPDLVICLKADSDVVYNRKKDLTKSEIIIQQSKYSLLRDLLLFYIDSNNSLKNSMLKIFMRIASLLKRNQKL